MMRLDAEKAATAVMTCRPVRAMLLRRAYRASAELR